MTRPNPASNELSSASPDEISRVVSSQAEATCWFIKEVQPHEHAVRGYLHNHFPSIDVDDVLQESYFRLLKAKAAGRITSVKAYLFSIARNTARTIFRRQRIYSDVPVSELPESSFLVEGDDASEKTNAHHQLELLADAIDRLPRRCREIMKLAVLRGFSTAEIAQELRLSENTIRVQLARGVKKCILHLSIEGKH